MKRALTILTSLSLLLGAFVASPIEVAATGNCAVAYVKVYDGTFAGSNRTYCYGVSDSNYSGETSTIMGPLEAGNYLPDFDAVSNTSGVTSYKFFDAAGGTDVTVCFYNNVDFNGLVQFDYVSGNYTMGVGVNNVTESFAMVSGTNCP